MCVGFSVSATAVGIRGGAIPAGSVQVNISGPPSGASVSDTAVPELVVTTGQEAPNAFTKPNPPSMVANNQRDTLPMHILLLPTSNVGQNTHFGKVLGS